MGIVSSVHLLAGSTASSPDMVAITLQVISLMLLAIGGVVAHYLNRAVRDQSGATVMDKVDTIQAGLSDLSNRHDSISTRMNHVEDRATLVSERVVLLERKVNRAWDRINLLDRPDPSTRSVS